MKQTSLGNMDGRKKSLERPKNNSFPWRIQLNVSSHWDCFLQKKPRAFPISPISIYSKCEQSGDKTEIRQIVFSA